MRRGSTKESVSENLNRRKVLQNGGLLTLVAAAPACEVLSLEPEEGPENDTDDEQGAEAPVLAERVKRGELPPVTDRLPREPVVLDPFEQLGSYGGTWRMAATSPSLAPWLMRQTMAYEGLLRWRPGTREFRREDIIPNVAVGYDAAPDGTEYVFHLREGMKWSDGAAFTADDVCFAVDDVLLNQEIFPITPAILVNDGDVGKVEKIDDFTVKFAFATPNGSFLYKVANLGEGFQLSYYPAHYLKDFHIEYNSVADGLASDEGFESWADLFDREAGGSTGLESSNKPGILAWQPVRSLDEATGAIIAERNPYYWKVDSDGRQLPYIDDIRYDIIPDTEAIVLRAGSGDIDMQYHFIEELSNKPVLAQTRQEGEYDFFETLPSEMNTTMIALNLTHKDDTLREIFSAKSFRIGLSYAIDRNEIIQLTYQGQGEPWQGAPRRESQYYSEEMAKQYTEFDIEAANSYLDRIIPHRDEQGRRLRPDGEPLVFQVDTRIESVKPEWPDVIELVRGYWRAVGVQVEMNGMDDSLWEQRKDANDFDASVHHGDGGLDVEILLRWYAPTDTWGSLFGLPWARWYQNEEDQSGREPPPSAMEQLELVRELEGTFDVDDRAAIVRRVLNIAAEEFWAIGVCLNPPGFGVVRNDFRNVPDLVLGSWSAGSVAGSNPAQFWIDRS